jgi:outer membrane protein TolC
MITLPSAWKFSFLRSPACRFLSLCSCAATTLGQTREELPVPDPAAARFEVADYDRQIGAMPSRPRSFSNTAPSGKVPTDFAPWWIRGQRASIGNQGGGRSFSVEELYQRALRHSKQIRVFSDLPLIRETGIQEAKGAFDTNTFLEGKFGHANDPVGNTLTTGGSNRFKQDQWTFEAGAKKKFVTGTEVTLSQSVGRTDNNSIYFVPNPQSTANLSLSVIQPILKGAGVNYNRSIMRIAKLDSQVAMSEFVRQSESHLLEITRTYWALYAARVMYLQKAKLVEETGKVVDEFRARQQVDARKTQLFRAQSALATRRSDLIRSEAAVRNAQDRLRALTSDPELLDAPDSELIPADRLILSSSPVDAQAAAQAALQNRPEITQAFLQLQAASIRENMARNELMPELNLVLQGSLGGLSGSDVGTSYGNQYQEGGPGYGVGFVFSFPLENNISRAHLERRRLETRQQINQIKTTIDTVLLEVKVSAREVATAYRETQAKFEAVHAFTEDLDSLQARRPIQDLRDEVQASSYLDTMLDAQDRRSDAEEEFIRAAANYQISIVNLQRAKGNLLVYSDVSVMRGRDEKNLPQLWLEKDARHAKAMSDGKSGL